MVRPLPINGTLASAQLRRLLEPVLGDRQSQFGELLSPTCQSRFQALLASKLNRGRTTTADMACELTNPSISLRTLISLKNFGKRLAKDAEGVGESAAGLLLYHAAIAAAFATFGRNISVLPIEQRLPFYDDLAAALHGTATAQVFRRAVDRAYREGFLTVGERKDSRG